MDLLLLTAIAPFSYQIQPDLGLMPPTSYPNEVIGLFAPAFPAAPILLKVFI